MNNEILKLTEELDGQEFLLSDFLSNSECGTCGEEYLEWEADFDADGTSHAATCFTCEKTYYITPVSYRLHVYDAEEEELR